MGTAAHPPAPTTAAPVAGPVDGSAALTEAGTTLRLGERAVLSYQAAVFTGLFDLDVCERDGLLPPWKPGATSAACTVFLLPDGTEPAGVTFPVVTTKFDSTSARDRVSWRR